MALMWLLDVNIPLALKTFLAQHQITVETAENRGWRQLENGDLVSAATTAGFHCLITRDKKIAQSAAKALGQYPEFAVVIITINQVKEPLYLKHFEDEWNKSPLQPIRGKVISWP